VVLTESSATILVICTKYQINGIFVCRMFARKLTALDYPSPVQFNVNGRSINSVVYGLVNESVLSWTFCALAI